MRPESRRDENERILTLGNALFRGKATRFGLLPADRLRHLYILGKTGSGKSTLLENLIHQDMMAGNGVAVLDPHGDLVRRVIALVPKSRTHDVLLFPGANEHPVAWNILRSQGSEPATTTSTILSIMAREWREFWGPRLEHILRHALLAVIPHPRATLLLVTRFLTDPEFRDRALGFVRDPVVRSFWEIEFPGYTKALQSEATSPILNKLGAITAHPVLRTTLGSVATRLDLERFTLGRGILLANLSTGELGEDASHLLGSLLLSSLLLAGAGRPRNAPPFFIYLDEFQYFVGESVGTMLAEARKYGLGLTMAHQFLKQLPDALAASVMGNVGSKAIFRIGLNDALSLEKEVEPEYTAYDVQRLEPFHFIAKVVARGRELSPFTAQSLPPVRVRAEERASTDALVRSSRERFGLPRQRIEAAINSSLNIVL